VNAPFGGVCIDFRPCRSSPSIQRISGPSATYAATHPAIANVLMSVEECPVPSRVRGSEAALQSRWQILRRANSESGSAQEPYCWKSRAPSRFIRCPRENKSRASHPRTGRGTPAATRRGRENTRLLNELRGSVQQQTAVHRPWSVDHSRHHCEAHSGL
jgi:hypothetical protein